MDLSSDPSPLRLLASLGGRTPSAPAWFTANLMHEPERHFVEVRGGPIETLSWGKRGAPGLLLLHGQGANADWWSFIAPFFAAQFRVTALSWSGMGRSAWRPAYDFAVHADEIFGVARACGHFDSARKPIIAAHSYGGMPLLYGAKARGGELGGAVVIDCYIRPDHQPPSRAAPAKELPARRYETLEQALGRFRLEPRQDCDNLFLIDHIARHSLKHVCADAHGPAGWTWRFDPELRSKSHKVAIAPYLAGMKCPLVMIAGERSRLVTPVVREYMARIAPPKTPFVLIPDADHHVMLDQPLALAAALRSVLSVWPEQAQNV